MEWVPIPWNYKITQIGSEIAQNTHIKNNKHSQRRQIKRTNKLDILPDFTDHEFDVILADSSNLSQ